MYIDGDVDEKTSASVAEHLALCHDCARLRDDFSAILAKCIEAAPGEAAPPNPAALWRRINNLIESELPSEIPLVEEKPKSWLSRGWSLTFSQAGFAVLGIALISSLLTIVGIRNYFEPPGQDLSAAANDQPSTMQRLLSKVGLAETQQQVRERRIKEQQAAVEYWNKRVLARRANWDQRMSAAFDRNLHEIDQAVSEYTTMLENDPNDELSVEMLDSALTEKMNLLRQFSEL